MQGCAGTQIGRHLATVDFQYVARFVQDWDDQRTIEVFVTAVTVEANLLQAGSNLSTRCAVLLRQSKAEGAIGVA